MNKYLLMSAAALLAGSGAAHAKTYSFMFASIYGEIGCQVGIITTGLAGGNAAAWIDTNNDCGGDTSQGAGLLENVKGLGKVWVLSDNYFAKNLGLYNTYVSWTLQKPIANGSAWTVWIGFSGISNFEENYGTLANVKKGAHPAKPHGRTSTVAKVTALRRALPGFAK